MRTKAIIGIAAASTATLLLAACSGSTSTGPATQDDGFTNFFDNNAVGEDALATITTGYPDSWSDCDGNGGFNPVFISNNTNETQTVSLDLNSTLARQVTLGSASDIEGQMQNTAAENGCMAGGQGSSANPKISIPAGQTYVGAILAGGTSGPHSDISSSTNNLSIGSGGSSWYQLRLELGINNGFKQWQLNYANTGGVADAGSMVNDQPGMFNAVSCTSSPTSSSITGKYVFPSSVNITTYYVSPWQKSANNQYQYGNNAPMCFAFLGVNGGTINP